MSAVDPDELRAGATEADVLAMLESSLPGGRAPELGLDLRDGLLRVVLQRPDRGNALRPQDGERLAVLFEHLARLDSAEIRAVLMAGQGRHFCTGGDLAAANADRDRRIGHLDRSLRRGAGRAVAAVWDCPLPTVAIVQGRATGLGLHLAAACDFIVASEVAAFHEPFAERGFAVDSGGSQLLPLRVGLQRATDLLLRGHVLDAATAATWGLVHEVVPESDLFASGEALATELAMGPTVALGEMKRLLRSAASRQLHEAMEREGLAVELTVRSKDFKEGIQAFRDRRAPNFTGR